MVSDSLSFNIASCMIQTWFLLWTLQIFLWGMSDIKWFIFWYNFNITVIFFIISCILLTIVMIFFIIFRKQLAYLNRLFLLCFELSTKIFCKFNSIRYIIMHIFNRLNTPLITYTKIQLLLFPYLTISLLQLCLINNWTYIFFNVYFPSFLWI